MPEPRLNCARMAARFCLRMWITMKLRIILAALTLTPALWAYQSSETANLPSAPSQTQVPKDSDPVTVLPQHQWKRFWFSGQMNIIELNRGTVGFAPFTAVRRLGYRLRATWYSTSKRPAEAVSAIPMAGFTNIDVVRIPGEGSPLSTAPCLARATVRYVFPLSRDREEAEPAAGCAHQSAGQAAGISRR